MTVMPRVATSTASDFTIASIHAFAAADAANHHPDLTITYPRVHVLLTTHDANGLTGRDVDLARTISAIAGELGATAEPKAVTQVEIAIDALDIPAVKPFWEAVLGYKPDQAPAASKKAQIIWAICVATMIERFG